MDPCKGGDLLCSQEGVYPVPRPGRREGGAGTGTAPYSCVGAIHHNRQHVPGHRAGGPRNLHPAQQVQGTRHPPAWGRVLRPWTAPTKTPTPTDPRGQTVAGARQMKKGPPTSPGLHHCPPHCPPTRGLLHGAPYRPGGASPAHHHRRPVHTRHPRTPLGPCHPLPHRPTLTPWGHPTRPPILDGVSRRIVGYPRRTP